MDPEKEFDALVKHFVPFVKVSKKDPVIMTVDGHYLHSRHIEVINCVPENGVHIVCLPPHSTQKLQHLDISFMQPLKTLRTGDRNLAEKPSRVDIYCQIAGLAGISYLKSATAAIAADGFPKTGLFSCSCHIFDELDPGRISAQHHECFTRQHCAMYKNCRKTAYH